MSRDPVRHLAVAALGGCEIGERARAGLGGLLREAALARAGTAQE
jgi:hypothetical protein